MNYKIILNGLGQDAPPLVYADRANYSVERLAYNLNNLWAANLARVQGFEADGPCVWISYNIKGGK
ncbi:MAG: hypothetical protein GY696_25070 [Gammaproteobacteria bacterium]|nr:hypothetical protein [Gammaproteobacteria bacterium]